MLRERIHPHVSKMQTCSYATAYTACIPQSAVMSSTRKLWEPVVQGHQNKAAKRDCKYITAHFSPVELNWQHWNSVSGAVPGVDNS